MRMQCFAAVFAALAVGSSFAFDIVREEFRATVVIPNPAESSSSLAAAELTNYVNKVTGASLQVCSGVEFGSRAGKIVIGTLGSLGDLVPEDVRQRLSSMRQAEAYYMGVRDGALYFVGKESTAELYAVYRFLEQTLGVRWFQAPVPEDPGEFVPKSNSLVFADDESYCEPFFAERRLDLTGARPKPLPYGGMTTALRNGFQISKPNGERLLDPGDPDDDFLKARMPSRRLEAGGHLTFVNAMFGKKCYEEHPEWFALVDGKRRCVDDPHMNQYCLSNPEVRQRVADNAMRWLEKTGGKGRYLFGQVDTPHGCCSCEACQSLDGPNERRHVSTQSSHTTRFVKTVNAICEKIYARYPRADLQLWAYMRYRELPDGVRPDPRLACQYCTHERCYGHALDDVSCERNRRQLALIRGWKELLPNLHLYEYLTSTPQYYTCNEVVQAKDIRLFKAMGLAGWKEEAPFSDASRPASVQRTRKDAFPSNWQWLCLTGHMLWNPDIDENAFLEDYESKYYGRAYPAMRKYHALRRKLWGENPQHAGYPTGDQRTATLLNRPGSKGELLALLDDAEQLAGDDPVTRFRIGRDRRWLTTYWIKANEEVRAVAEKSFKVPRAIGKVEIDGDGSDPAWTGAYYVDRFYRCGSEKAPKPLETPLQTSAGITYDEENLYFLLTAGEPQPELMRMSERIGADVWADDGFEIFLFPPSIENKCYHLAVNAKGNMWARTIPGGTVEGAFGAEAVGRIHDGKYVIEVRIPSKNVAPLKAGSTWRALVGRNRVMREGANGSKGAYSVDGVRYSDTISFRPMELGGGYLKNGSFEELDQRGSLKNWECPYGVSVVEGVSGKAVNLKKNQCVLQAMWGGRLRQASRVRKLRYSLKASGKGAVDVWFKRWRDSEDPSARQGYRREGLEPSSKGTRTLLADEEKVVSGEHTVPPNEWHSIAIGCADGNVVVDDVVVQPLD